MSDDGFLKRWSRRKRAERSAADAWPAEAKPVEPPPSNLPPQTEEGGASSPPQRSGEGQHGVAAQAGRSIASEVEEIDPDTLPPLESLGPDSDYTVFLKKGVPEALRIAALRKAWMSDAFIRDFRSPAIEYGWDFTTPDYNLRATDNVEKLLDQILPRETPTQETPPEGRSAAAGGQPTDGGEAPKADAPAHGAAKPDLSLPQKQAGVPTTPARKAEPAPSLPRRKHGGALPG